VDCTGRRGEGKRFRKKKRERREEREGELDGISRCHPFFMTDPLCSEPKEDGGENTKGKGERGRKRERKKKKKGLRNGPAK